MTRIILRLYMLAALGLAGSAVNAHECRQLGGNFLSPALFDSSVPYHANYYLCVGFSQEDGVENPGPGRKNNLDFFPLWVDEKGEVFSLDIAKGDKVKFTATLKYLNDVVYHIPWNQETGLIDDPLFYFKAPSSSSINPFNVGYESLPKTQNCKIKWQKTIKNPVPQEWDGLWSYRAPNDFILPYKGMYAWVIEGKLQRKGQDAAYFSTKWTCQQPQKPMGPWNPLDLEGSVTAGPDGWYDCAVFGLPDVTPATARAVAANSGSPTIEQILGRQGLKLQRQP